MDTNVAINITAFIFLAILWLAFAAALLFNRELLRKTWQQFRRANILLQWVVWLLALPVVFGLWIWQTALPGWLRLALVGGLAWMTMYTFFPRVLFA